MYNAVLSPGTINNKKLIDTIHGMFSDQLYNAHMFT